MIELEASWPLVLIVLALAAAFVTLTVRRRQTVAFLSERVPCFDTVRAVAHVVVAILCVPAGFFLMEFPCNARLFEMDPTFVAYGLTGTAVVFLFVHCALQRSRLSMMAFLALCFMAGVANHYVALFKGQPVLPSDLFALQTAASVSGGYVYAVDDSILGAFVVLELFACAMPLLPKVRLTPQTVAVNCIAALAIGSCAFLWFGESDIENDYDCQVDVWSSLDSYRQQGSLLCFLQRAQQLTPKEPANYSSENAHALLTGSFPSFGDDSEILATDALSDDAQALAPDVRPSIVVVMNETFSDLSAYSAIDPSYEGPINVKALAEEALLSGDAFVSALGGGTCNSEFEFLTGSTTGLLGAGVYPYMLYNLQGVDSMASYLSSLGYGTTAIHPAEASNWRRDRVYQQLGFDAFYDIESFDDTETRRGLVTDAATYDLVLQTLEESEGPQFIFDVTIANHGGYTTGEVPEDERVNVVVNGAEDAEVDEYLSCLTQSDLEFASFIDQLRELDRPVVVCLFGDHQPGFADRLAEASTGTSVSKMTIEQTQERYTTPYVVWTNDATLRDVYGVGNVRDLSLNYLGANVLKAAGLPLDEYFAFTLSVERLMPAINLNGYQDALGAWHWHDEENAASNARSELAIVQHENLFGRSSAQ